MHVLMMTASMSCGSTPAWRRARSPASDAIAGACVANRACSKSGRKSNTSLRSSIARKRLQVPLSPRSTFLTSACDSKLIFGK